MAKSLHDHVNTHSLFTKEEKKTIMTIHPKTCDHERKSNFNGAIPKINIIPLPFLKDALPSKI
jgi:hypothetical protein